MTINRHVENGVVILEAAGSLMRERPEHPLVGAVQDALHEGFTSILVNMERVADMDAGGLAELFTAYMVTAAYGGQLELEYVAPGIRTLLQATELAGVVPMFDEEAQALAAFARKPRAA